MKKIEAKKKEKLLSERRNRHKSISVDVDTKSQIQKQLEAMDNKNKIPMSNILNSSKDENDDSEKSSKINEDIEEINNYIDNHDKFLSGALENKPLSPDEENKIY